MRATFTVNTLCLRLSQKVFKHTTTASDLQPE